jgi:hypothetical protein
MKTSDARMLGHVYGTFEFICLLIPGTFMEMRFASAHSGTPVYEDKCDKRTDYSDPAEQVTRMSYVNNVSLINFRSDKNTGPGVKSIWMVSSCSLCGAGFFGILRFTC